MSSMFEAIRKDNGEPIAGTLVELKGRSFILPDTLGSIGASYECKTKQKGALYAPILAVLLRFFPKRCTGMFRRKERRQKRNENIIANAVSAEKDKSKAI